MGGGRGSTGEDVNGCRCMHGQGSSSQAGVDKYPHAGLYLEHLPLPADDSTGLGGSNVPFSTAVHCISVL